jgi:uncharacterized protein (TIGR03083 family)
LSGVMDAIAEWTRAQQRVIELVSPLTEEQAGIKVPACPDWTVRDLLSHMVGLDADVLGGDEPDDHNGEWTQAQVDARVGRDVATLVEEWAALTEPLGKWMAEHSTRPLGDVVIHEQDLRGALKVAGGQDGAGLASLRDTFAGRLGDAVSDLPSLALVGDEWTWTSRGDASDAEVLIRTSDFDLTRALMSRRSEAQLRAWTQRGDVVPFLSKFELLGPLPDDDLSETF